jgi:phosphatidylserine/phosphatidylglycerophosphate/cardiolipin synthase-like enzyme
MTRNSAPIIIVALSVVLAVLLPHPAFAQSAGSSTATDSDIAASSSQSQLDELSTSRRVPGNHVTVLDHGPSAFRTWREVISQARSSIYLQTYYLEDEGMCSQLIDILKSKASQGVKVAIIITRYSQMGKAPLTYLEIKKAGIDVILVGSIGFPKEIPTGRSSWFDRMKEDERIFRSLPREAPFRQWFDKEKGGELMVDFALHEKMLVVDGTTAIIGGRNLSDCYFFWWQDLDVAIEGPIVTEIARAFERNWYEFGGHPLPQSTPLQQPPFNDGISVRLTQSRPWHGGYHNLDMLCGAIDMAKERVCISSQYLALPPKLRQVLIDAAGRGVDVRILTNSMETGREVNLSLCHFISLNYYDDLLRAGVGIYEYQSPPGLKLRPYFHAKQFIIDGKYLAIGSFNLSIRSSYLESEIMLSLVDPVFAGIQEKKFLQELEGKTSRISRDILAAEEKHHHLLMEMAKRLEILY